jgi:hypothetical protein
MVARQLNFVLPHMKLGLRFIVENFSCKALTKDT